MTRVDVASAGWLLLLMAAVAGVTDTFARGGGPAPAGLEALRDATGQPLPSKTYRRIASTSVLADELLVELADPTRIVALSARGRFGLRGRLRLAPRAEVASAGDLERLLALRADLVIVNHMAPEAQLARARSAGIEVFDLGELRGLSTLRPAIVALASLLGDRARGERLFRDFWMRLRAVASDVPRDARKQALYVASYAGHMFGGTRGTSYHDVLVAAGLIDVAAARYRDWPRYDPEQIMQLDPPLIVTNAGMRAELCAEPWQARLRACNSPHGVLELPANVIGDPGLGMLAAAEQLHALAYAKKAP